MTALSIQQTRHWLKTSKNPLAIILFKKLKALRSLEIPAPKFASGLLYYAYCSLRTMFTSLTRIFWWTPLFKGRLESFGRGLYLYGGLPFISGPVNIQLGDNCRISGQSTFSGRASTPEPTVLKIGNNIDIGWMTTIAVGRTVLIGDNVRIAGRCLLIGYPGHPIDAEARAAGLPETSDQVGDIILEDDVWLATGVSVMADVRIGRGTVVAAGSVVTRDLPPMVLAAGVPAKVIRSLDDDICALVQY